LSTHNYERLRLFLKVFFQIKRKKRFYSKILTENDSYFLKLYYTISMDASEYSKRLKETGRNDPCPCGSGKKYKKCHLPEDEKAKHADFVKAEEERKAAAAAAADDEAEENVDDIDTKILEKAKKNSLHGKSGHVNKGKGGQQNIPRRGAI
jgi:hypothetical protein